LILAALASDPLAFGPRCDILKMNMRLIFLLLLGCAGTLWGQTSTSVNDQARFLAGLPVRDSGLEPYSHDAFWMDHATALDAAWGKQESRQLLQVRAWSHLNVPDSDSAGVVYYMFSGPDFLYANAFYPEARTYILCGNEPVGSVPDITRIPPEQLAPALEGLRQSMGTILKFHYFITKEMRVDLNRTHLGGTLPILLVFMARSGCTIHDVSYVQSPASGVKIDFAGRGGRPQTLYYFKCDLSNGAGNSGFLRWCAQQGPGLSLLKAASYLMHSDSFSTVRNFLLQNSSVIVQDDSGIPFHDFDSNRFAVRLYGSYAGPIELFAKNTQPDLLRAYAASGEAPLGFAFGYHWQVERGMVMVATRRQERVGSR